MADKDVTPFPYTSSGEPTSGTSVRASEVDITSSSESSEPPVVARMMIEIRSDGSRTVARGALEEVESGKTVSIVAEADTPTALAWSLAKKLAAAPLIGRAASRALLPETGETSKSVPKAIDVAVGKKRSLLGRAVETARERARRQVKSIRDRVTSRILESAFRVDPDQRDDD